MFLLLTLPTTRFIGHYSLDLSINFKRHCFSFHSLIIIKFTVHSYVWIFFFYIVPSEILPFDFKPMPQVLYFKVLKVWIRCLLIKSTGVMKRNVKIERFKQKGTYIHYEESQGN